MAKKASRKTKYWWVYLVFGIIALIAAGNIWSYHLSTLSAIASVIGFFLVFAGAANIITTITDREHIKFWWLYTILSVLIIAAGVTIFARPSLAIKFIWLIAGLGFACEAVIEIIHSINLKKEKAEGWIPLLILAIITGLAALAILSDPLSGLWFISVFFALGVVCFGIRLIIFAFQTKPEKK